MPPSSEASSDAEAGTHIKWTNRRRASPVGEWLRVAVFTANTARVALLAALAPFVCMRFNLTGHTFDPSILSLLIATPAAFLISAAFQRREHALHNLSELRAVAVSLHRAFGLYGSPEQAAAGQRAVQGTFSSFSRHLRSYEPESLEATYRHMQTVSWTIERMRLDPTDSSRPQVETIIGRQLFDERSLMRLIEALRLVRSFRTPAILRGFLLSSCTVLPIIQAPNFAHELHHTDVFWAPLALSVLFAVANATLVNIQAVMEDPFDGDTADDISLILFEPNWAFWTDHPVQVGVQQHAAHGKKQVEERKSREGTNTA